MEKKNFTNNILESLEGAKKAMPSEEFLSRMENMAAKYAKVPKRIPIRSLLGIAASLLILVFANVYVLSNQNNAGSSEETAIVYDSYDLIPSKSIYNE